MCLREKIGPDPRNFNQRVSLGRNDLLIRTFPKDKLFTAEKTLPHKINFQITCKGCSRCPLQPMSPRMNILLDDDTTLMSTTDVHITHANDTFVQVSGYQLDELTGQPHNMVRHPDMPKAAFADMCGTRCSRASRAGLSKPAQKR
jgi:PAS domain-containing protein